jgi:uncharacterized protein YukE
MSFTKSASLSTSRRESINNSLVSKLEEKQKISEKEKISKSKITTKSSKPETEVIQRINLDSSPNKTSERDTEVESMSMKGLETEFEKFRNEIKGLFKEFDSNIDRKLEKFEEKFATVLKEFKQEMITVRQELTDTKSEVKDIKTQMKELEKSVAFHAEEAEDRETRYEAKLNRTQAQLEELERKILLQEKHDRRYNLLFYGFPEQSDENLSELMKTFFKDKLEIDENHVNKMAFANLHRIPTEGKGPKPVIVKFISMADRDIVFSKAFHPSLRDEKKRILTDLPVVMKRERGRLARIAYDIRQEEKLKTRIQETGLSVYLEVRKAKEDFWERRDV